MNTENASDTVDFDQILSRESTSSLKWDRYRGRDILPFWVADMDFQVAPPIQRALAARLSHPIYGYTMAPDGLSAAIISHLQAEYSWRIERDWLVYLPGVVAGLAASCRAYCKDGDEIMVNPPIYHHFFNSHEADRQQLVNVPLHKQAGRWTYDLNAMADACTERTAMLMMCTPHNPTGTVFTEAELRAVAELCEQRDMVMISDEIHCDLVIDAEVRHVPTAVACPAQADRIVTLMSSSKTWNIAGMNCSFAIISNPQLRRSFQQACESTVPMVPTFSYVATEAAYRDGDVWRQDLIAYLRNNFAYLQSTIDEIPGLKLEPLQATYLAWIDAGKLGVDDAQAFFEQHGVGLSAGEQFGMPGYVRLNFACPQQTLAEGVRRMAEAVASLQ